MKSRPNFFIIGAPKCGTTALSEYLRQHPRVGFSKPKEPIYFSFDFPKACNYRDEATYLKECFEHCEGQDYLAIGEGSTAYFFSEVALLNILQFEPDARFIVMLRNPVEMIYAMHAQKILSLEEDELDFEKAWALQAERIQGRRLPKHAKEPQLLQYAKLGKLSLHLARIFKQVPKSQIKVILFDDFARNPSNVYIEVLEFLGVPSDNRNQFPRINESRRLRLLWLYEFSHRPPPKLMHIINAIKGWLGIQRLNITPRLIDWNIQAVRRPPLTSEMRRILVNEFANDIDRLGSMLCRDLSHWKA